MSHFTLSEFKADNWSYMAICMREACERIIENKSFDPIVADIGDGIYLAVIRFLENALEGGEDYYPILTIETHGAFNVANEAIRKTFLPLPAHVDGSLDELFKQHYQAVCELLKKYLCFVNNIRRIGIPTKDDLAVAEEFTRVLAAIHQHGELEFADRFYRGQCFPNQ